MKGRMMSYQSRAPAKQKGTGPGERSGGMRNKFKKLTCVILSMLLCLGLCVNVFAADGLCDVYITDSSWGEQYKVYKIFDLTYSGSGERDGQGNTLWDNVAYTMAADSPWFDIIEDGYFAEWEDETTWSWHESPFELTLNSAGSYTVTMKEELDTGVEPGEVYIGQFFRNIPEDMLEVAYGIEPMLFDSDGKPSADGSLPQADTNGRVYFQVPNGYYFVVSTLGTQVMAFSATSTGYVVQEKNPIPELDKEVWDEESGQWVQRESVKPGDELQFEVLIYNAYHQNHLILHDTMSSGLALEHGAKTELGENFQHDVEVYLGTWSEVDGEQVPNGDWTRVSSAYYHLYVTEDEYDDEDPDEDLDPYGEDAFQIAFSDEFLESIEENNVIQVIYYAVVTDDVFMEGAEDDEINAVHVTYGANGSTIPVETEQYDFSFDIRKVDAADWSDEQQDYLYSLDGAVFQLHRVDMEQEDLQDATQSVYTIDEDPIQFVWQEAGEHIHEDEDGNQEIVVYEQGYRYATEEEIENEESTADLAIKGGECGVYGLSEGWYYLEEIEAPEGYALLDEGFLIWVGEVQEDGFHERVYVNGEQLPDDNETLTVVNYPGDMMIETGGAGTWLYTLVGALLMGGAVCMVVIVNRRRKEDTG